MESNCVEVCPFTLIPFFQKKCITFFHEFYNVQTDTCFSLLHSSEDQPYGIINTIEVDNGFLFATIILKTSDGDQSFPWVFSKDAIEAEAFLKNIMLKQRGKIRKMETT